MTRRPAVVLSGIHYRYQHYYDYLATGFHLLEADGEIDFRCEVSSATRLLGAHRRVPGLLKRIAPSLEGRLSQGEFWCIPGRVRFGDRTVRFAYDVDDPPFGFHLPLLERSDLYFKCQHPLTISDEGFELSTKVRIPFAPGVIDARHKIRPAMLGRPLSRTLKLRKNLAVLDRWRRQDTEARKVALLAFFGSDRPPSAHQAPNEAEILRRYEGQLSHPNLKRGEIVSWLRSRFGGSVDARIVNTAEDARRGADVSDADYPSLVASAMFSLNISGFRRSLPFRFIDSFLVGTGVLSDELGVRWYQPFARGVEVIELGKLGYELAHETEWARAKAVIEDVVSHAAAMHARARPAIRDRFERYWHPRALARYVLEECRAAA